MGEVDFYVGRGKRARYIGGCHSGGQPRLMAAQVLNSRTEQEFRDAIANLPEAYGAMNITFGWPWKWTHSRDTAYTYSFWKNAVYVSFHGAPWLDVSRYDWTDRSIDRELEQNRATAEKIDLPDSRAVNRQLGLTTRKVAKLADEHVGRLLEAAFLEMDRRENEAKTGDAIADRPKSHGFVKPRPW